MDQEIFKEKTKRYCSFGISIHYFYFTKRDIMSFGKATQMDHIDIPLHFRRIKENIKDIRKDQRIYLFQGWHKSTYKVQISSFFYRHSHFELNPML